MKNIILILSMVILASNIAEAKVVNEHVYIVPAGKVDSKALQAIKGGLQGAWPVNIGVEIFPGEAITASAYNASSGRYNAEVILDDIARRITIVPSTERVLIVVDVDMYVPGSDSVLGVADEKKGFAVVSLTRLRNEFYGLAPNESLFRERVLKEAIREAAHSRGIDSCSDPKCIMFSSNEIADMDKKKAKFCHSCRNRLYYTYGEPMFKMPGEK